MNIKELLLSSSDPERLRLLSIDSLRKAFFKELEASSLIQVKDRCYSTLPLGIDLQLQLIVPGVDRRLPAFYMSKYPITQYLWKKVITTLPGSREVDPEPSHFTKHANAEDLPVESITYYEAIEFCQRLSNHTGDVYRLPTVEEWKFACKREEGFSLTTETANFANAHGKTTPVGIYTPNEFDLCDMEGNVWEWCQDHWAIGGCYNSRKGDFDSYEPIRFNSYTFNSYTTSSYLGFRVVREV